MCGCLKWPSGVFMSVFPLSYACQVLTAFDKCLTADQAKLIAHLLWTLWPQNITLLMQHFIACLTSCEQSYGNCLTYSYSSDESSRYILLLHIFLHEYRKFRISYLRLMWAVYLQVSMPLIYNFTGWINDLYVINNLYLTHPDLIIIIYI